MIDLVSSTGDMSPVPADKVARTFQSLDTSLTSLIANQRNKGNKVTFILGDSPEERDPDTVAGFFKALDSDVAGWIQVGHQSSHGLALALYQMRKLWDGVPLTETAPWGHSFIKYSESKTGLAWSTINNACRVAEVFLSGDVKLVGAPKHFNPFIIRESVLLLAVHKASTGTLTAREWKYLSNPETTWTEMRNLLQGILPDTKKGEQEVLEEDEKITVTGDGMEEGVVTVPPKQHKFFSQAGIIYYTEGKIKVPVLQAVSISDVDPDLVPYLNRGQALIKDLCQIKDR